MFKKLFLATALTMGAANASTINFVIEVSGLKPMKGQHYEGWNIVKGKALSTGRFSISKKNAIYEVNAKGKAVRRAGENGKATFHVDAQQAKSSLFVLTIEPNGDKDPSPSDIHVMGGRYSQGRAQLDISHSSSIGSNFHRVRGSFILAAPTGGDFNQGIWFLDPSSGIGSLELPKLPRGWTYEGWIVNTENNAKFSTGIFHDANGIDSDAAGRFSGVKKLDFPKVAGQDIVKTPVILNDGKHAIVVTVEPYPDYDPAPYDIKILKSDLSKDVQGMTPLELENISHNSPRGLVHIH